MGKQWKQWQTLFWGAPKITADGDCKHEIKRCLFLGGRVLTKLDSILKSRDITLPTKVYIVKTMVFPAVMYGCESWTIKKPEYQRTDAKRLFRVPWTARRSSQSTLKSILNIHWKSWCWSFNTLVTWWKQLTHWERPWSGKDWGQEEKRVGWDHPLKGHAVCA